MKKTGKTDLKELDEGSSGRDTGASETFARDGFRVLGVAWKRVETTEHHAVVDDETALVFAGFAAFLDPPKESAQEALAKLAQAGVAVKVVTGDNELVTRHICEKLGLPITGILTGAEMQDMDDHALSACVENVNLFCRVNPAQKNRVILALKQRGRVVGYMGDGINDAPSLHSADIGISVDSAVDVAKSAAEMILLEQDLNVLHEGVMEGRRTFGNIMKYIMMGTSSNFGNMFSMAGATLFLPFLPMLPVQILLNNLLYDVSEIPIPLDSVDEEYLTQPRHWNMNFIRNFMLSVGPVSSVFDFLTFYIMLHRVSCRREALSYRLVRRIDGNAGARYFHHPHPSKPVQKPSQPLAYPLFSFGRLHCDGASVHSAWQILRVRPPALIILCDPGRHRVVLSLCGRRDQAVVL